MTSLQKTSLNQLHKAGLKKNLDILVPHEVRSKNVMDRISMCESQLRRNEIDPFWKKLITVNENWVTYDNNLRKRSWSKKDEVAHKVEKPGLTPHKVMLFVWWDWKEIEHLEQPS